MIASSVSRLRGPYETKLISLTTEQIRNNLIWHTDAKTREQVEIFNDESIKIMRGTDAPEYVDFQNSTRTGPIELRYRGPGKLEQVKGSEAEMGSCQGCT